MKKIIIIESTAGMSLGWGYPKPYGTGLGFIYSSPSENMDLSRIQE
jgi:hypothetical protein